MEAAEARARQPPNLPVDILLEIVARCDDATTVVRCAAGCKPLRRAMLGPGFLDLLRRRADANGGFDPSLLMAVSYGVPVASSTGIAKSIVVQPPGRLRLDTDLRRFLESSITSSSREGLLAVLGDGILVCNTITGHVTSLPGLRWSSAPKNLKMFQPALLSVNGAGRTFELLVMSKHGGWPDDWGLTTQIISSQEDKWGATREINLPEGLLDLTEALSSAPAVVGRTVHWLCSINIQSNGRQLAILALHDESAHASVIRLPQELVKRMGMGKAALREVDDVEERILATTATTEGERWLSLVVAEALVISTWTLVWDTNEGSSMSWNRQVVIRRREIDRPHASALDAYQPILFKVFGERSGTVLFWMDHVGLVQLNLGTKKALVLWRYDDSIAKYTTSEEFLNEINLISVLECMKSF